MDKAKFTGSLANVKRQGKLVPAPMSLSGASGKRIVVSTAKRVIKEHSAVIKALAKR